MDDKYVLVRYEQKARTFYNVLEQSNLYDSFLPNKKCFISDDNLNSYTCDVIKTSNYEEDLISEFYNLLEAAAQSYVPKSSTLKPEPKYITDAHFRMITLGPNGNVLPASTMNRVRWNFYTTATYGLLEAVFSKEVLATHTLKGDASRMLFKLEERKVEDVIYFISRKFALSKKAVIREIRFKCKKEFKRFFPHEQS
ncbi:PREDICTED: early boundary activity protein 2-like [Nicrophorus vespilloides]|uniref:Early boundary activity protein 2-like n=1 Tax=Nicrophorus vespilloides TaxID=110193 RepID=A0ABM1NK25_NICVS|nr:PREDICTED: early boundary activity protein 2-like [Nicrophorus vespilloides]